MPLVHGGYLSENLPSGIFIWNSCTLYCVRLFCFRRKCINTQPHVHNRTKDNSSMIRIFKSLQESKTRKKKQNIFMEFSFEYWLVWFYGIFSPVFAPSVACDMIIIELSPQIPARNQVKILLLTFTEYFTDENTGSIEMCD